MLKKAFCALKSGCRCYTVSETIDYTSKYLSKNYEPLDVVVVGGDRCIVWDDEGKRYIDFMGGYYCANQGHCHPKIIGALQDQASKISLTSRAFYSDQLGPYAEFMTDFFGYDQISPMNTGSEAVETAIKLARKWGHEAKGIPDGDQVVVSVHGNFHGRTLLSVSMSSHPVHTRNCGPMVPNMEVIEFGNIESLVEKIDEHGENICGFVSEPILGAGGIILPPEGYLGQVKKLCEENNILFICDEVLTGLAKTGKMTCIEHYDIRPDILMLGKALGGGVYPVSAVLADSDIMDRFTVGTHGSTFGGNPLGCAVAKASIEVLVEENLCDNSLKMGNIFRDEMERIRGSGVELAGLIKEIRGMGLLNAVEMNEEHEAMVEKDLTAGDICMRLISKGLLTYPSGANLRCTPPCVISEEEIRQCCNIMEETFHEILE